MELKALIFFCKRLDVGLCNKMKVRDNPTFCSATQNASFYNKK